MMATIGRYEILEELGRGGFATVYKARDTQLNRLVALKVLHASWTGDPDFVQRFQQEAETAANFRHPNIVVIYDVGEIDRQLFISMEYLPGQNLHQWLEKREQPLTVEEALPILEPLADALDYAHQQGVIHRDIKPSNVMFHEADGKLRVVLTDFGLVKAMINSVAVTKTGQTLGSPEYMAPEQADPNRQNEVGPHTDLYAFGIMAYQILTGRVPFPGNSISTLFAHANLAVPPPQEINDALADEIADILIRMLAKAPGERYSTARAFTGALQSALQKASRTKSIEAQVAPLYNRLEQAKAAEDWVAMLTLSTQIESIIPGYRNVIHLQAEAQQQLRAPKPEPPSIQVEPPLKKVPEPVVEQPPQSKSRSETVLTQGTRPIDKGKATDPAAQGSKRPLPKGVWAIGGGIILVMLLIGCLAFLIVPGLLPDSDNQNGNGNLLATTTAEGESIVTNPTPIPSNTPGSPATAAFLETAASATEELVDEVPTLRPTLTPTVTPTGDPSIPPPNPTLESTWTRPADDMVMVYVPAGTFLMGSDPESDPNAGSDEQPQHEVTLDGFWIDQTEVANEQYNLCVQDGSCNASEYAGDSDYNGDTQPVVGVSWFDAEDYCTWVDGQLPTEAQWEYAARGEDGRLYPWGNEFDGQLVNFCDTNCSQSWKDDNYDDGYALTAPVGSYPGGASWVDAFDMAGNVWEWVQDWYDSDYYENSLNTDPTGPETGSNRVLRGGSWGNVAASVRSAYRFFSDPTNSNFIIGFRCAAPGP